MRARLGAGHAPRSAHTALQVYRFRTDEWLKCRVVGYSKRQRLHRLHYQASGSRSWQRLANLKVRVVEAEEDDDRLLSAARSIAKRATSRGASRARSRSGLRSSRAVRAKEITRSLEDVYGDAGGKLVRARAAERERGSTSPARLQRRELATSGSRSMQRLLRLRRQ